MYEESSRRITDSIILIALGVVLVYITIVDDVTIAEPVTIFLLIGGFAGAAALLKGGTDVAEFMRNRPNRLMVTVIFQVFLKTGVMTGSDLELAANKEFENLDAILKGKFEKDRFDKAVAVLRFDGRICADADGIQLWWKCTGRPPIKVKGKEKVQPE